MSGAMRIVDAYWNRFLAVEPLFATLVGDARFDDVLPDPSEEGRAERQRVHAGLLEAAAAVDTSGLDPEQRRTLLLAGALARRELGCLTHNLDRLWAVGHMPIGHRFGPGLLLGVVAFQQPAATAWQRAAYLRRLAAFPAYLRAVAANAAEGLASGLVASRAVVTRTIGQVERLLATPVADSPGLAPLGTGSDEERSRGAEVLRERVYPAYARLLEVLRDYLPRAQESLGLLALPGGEEIYRSEVLGWTTLPLEPDVVHRLGLEQLQQVQEERTALARRLGHAGPAEAVAALQGRPGGRLDSREAILARARDQVARSWQALPGWFGRLPGRNCEVTPVDLAHEDDLSEYYLAGTAERAGTYFVNTRAPRPAYDLAATSFHEANPGHHLQSALELEAPDRHALRRNASELQGAAYGEGWGLYSERLADEMGLYADDAERLGMLDQQALRAARLVVDTGIHAFGWTRERSIATLRASGCDGWLAASETDRYSAIPGQALTYKLGQLEIDDLRKRWVAGGGEVSGFHDALLGLGLLPLANLRTELETAAGVGHDCTGYGTPVTRTPLFNLPARHARRPRHRLGARGMRLSGGQAQRIATARAVTRRPDLLVLDDVSSALDVDTERALWDRLLRDTQATLLVVSNRPATLARAAQVVTLDHGHRTAAAPPWSRPSPAAGRPGSPPKPRSRCTDPRLAACIWVQGRHREGGDGDQRGL